MTSEDFVPLKDGTLFPVPALALALRLEAAGFTFEDQGGVLRVGRVDGAPVVLSESDKEEIRKWKQPLLVVVSYARQQR